MAMNFLRPTSAAALLVLLGITIRILCSTGELWFDELWTVSMTRSLESAYRAFTIPHDNRHPLTSFWVQYVPTTFPYWAFRLESLILSSVSGVTLLVVVRNSLQPFPNLLWLLFYSTSYLFVLYDSEARGYAGMIASVMGLYYLKERIFFSASVSGVLHFITLGALGILSHALFITFLIPYVAWGWYATIWSNARWWATKWMTMSALLLVLGVAVPLYAKMEIGGAPVVPYIQVIGSALLLSIGGDAISAFNVENAVWQLLFGITFLALLALELILWIKDDRDQAIFVLLAILSPLLAVAVAQPYFILPRYFLVPILFCYLLFARSLIRLAAQGTVGLVVTTSIIVAFVTFNTRHILHLYSEGRSSLGRTLSLLALEKPNSKIGGNRDFQMQVQLPLLVARNPDLNGVTFLPNYLDKIKELDFILVEHIDREEPARESLWLEGDTTFTKVVSWKAPPESGANLSLYRKKTTTSPDSSLFLPHNPG
jgi:hypothetical protein